MFAKFGFCTPKFTVNFLCNLRTKKINSERFRAKFLLSVTKFSGTIRQFFESLEFAFDVRRLKLQQIIKWQSPLNCTLWGDVRPRSVESSDFQ